MRSVPATAIAIALSAAVPASAQDGGEDIPPVSVKTVLRPDGTRVVTTSDPTERTSVAVTYSGDKVLQRVVYRLDERGQPASGEVFDGKEKLLYRMELKVDAAGRVLEERDFDLAGNLLRRLAFTYDPRGRLERTRVFDAAGNEVKPGGSAARKDERKTPPRRQ